MLAVQAQDATQFAQPPPQEVRAAPPRSRVIALYTALKSAICALQSGARSYTITQQQGRAPLKYGTAPFYAVCALHIRYSVQVLMKLAEAKNSKPLPKLKIRYV